MKLFVGLRPSEAAVESLAEPVGRVLRSLPRARPTDPAIWHVTLAFIGELPDGRLSDVTAALSEAVTGLPVFELHVAGGGHFGSSVFFANLDGDTDALHATTMRVREALADFGVPMDQRPPRAHLTVARIPGRGSHQNLQDGIDVLAGYRGPSWRVRDILLYRSRPGPPVHYDVLHHFPLTA
ncbi:MAG: RNA 2',3'-cyclic phosphodiesterase [Stackebrandtia sp.]